MRSALPVVLLALLLTTSDLSGQGTEAGAIGLDDPIAGHLPDSGSALTVRQAVRERAADPLLERLVARASGQTYQRFVRDRQLTSLGLRPTFSADELSSVPREALAPGQSHERFLHEPALIDPAKPATGYRGTAPATSPGAALYAPAADISLWDIALAGGILVKDPSLRRILYAPATLDDGVQIPTSGPWFSPGHPGLMIVTGSGDAFSSPLSRFTRSDELVCVTLLANTEGLRRVRQSPYAPEATLVRAVWFR